MWDWIKSVFGGGKATPPRQAEISPEMASELAWRASTTVLDGYLQFLSGLDLPAAPDLWRDDFMIGLRDGVGRAHFSFGEMKPYSGLIPTDAEERWRKHVVKGAQLPTEPREGNTLGLGSHSDRYNKGFMAAMVLQSWHMKRELLPGIRDLVNEYDQQVRDEIRDEIPDPPLDMLRDEIGYRLIMAQLVEPLTERYGGAETTPDI